MSPKVMDFETFAALHGASRQAVGDAGLHNPAGHMPASTWRRWIADQVKRDEDWFRRREELRAEFAAAVARGEIREPTGLERLHANASGDPENPSVQAARRILAKREAMAREAKSDA